MTRQKSRRLLRLSVRSPTTTNAALVYSLFVGLHIPAAGGVTVRLAGIKAFKGGGVSRHRVS